MFTLEQPSIALNSIDFPDEIITMQITTEPIRSSESKQDIINRVVNAANSVRGRRLKNVVFNCHGLPGYIDIGQGFDSSDLWMFETWAPMVHKIWLIACKVARIPTPQMQAQLNSDYPGLLTGNGDTFCRTLARNSGAYVVAPTQDQVNAGGYAMGQMPTFEGLLLSYDPRDDRRPWQRYYRSGIPAGNGMMIPPSGE